MDDFDDLKNTIKRIEYQYLALPSVKKSKIRDELSKKLLDVIDLLNSAEKDEKPVKAQKESFTPTISEPLPPFYEEENTEDKRFSADTNIENFYDLWKNSPIEEKFRFVCSNDDNQEFIYFNKLDLDDYTDELKDIRVDMWAYPAGDECLQVWLNRKNFMKIKRRKSIYCNPICGTMIRVFTICDDDYVTFRDPSTNDLNDCFMVKWENVPQKIKNEIGVCTNNLLGSNYDLEEHTFFWSFSLSKCEYNHVVNLLCDNA